MIICKHTLTSSLLFMLCQISRVRHLFTKPVLFHCLGRHLKAKSTQITISAKRRSPRINRYQKVWSHLACFRKLGWPSIKDQLLVRDTTQVYKIVNGLAPLNLSSKLRKRSDTHHCNTSDEKGQSKFPSMQNSYRATVILLSRCKCLELSDHRH